MTKKKRDRVDVEDIIARPWCYYCDRDFDDQKVLIEHQRAKHFHCPVNTCHRRLNTAGGLSVHLSQVHKETLSSIANALESRKGVEPEVFGMMGIPEELVEARRQRILNEFFKEEAEHRARTGNPPPGQKQGEPNSKKRKIESTEELKARAAEFRAKRAAERQAAKEGKTVAQSASNAPDTAQGQGHTAMDTNPALPPNLQPSYDQMQSYGPQFQAPHHGLPLQSPINAGVQSPFPVAQPRQWPPYSSPASFSPPQAAPYPPPPFMYPVHSPMTGQMPGSMIPNHNVRYTHNAPADRQAVTVAQTPLQPAPGLPVRPSFDLPDINRDDMHRMHTGQVPPINKTAYQQHSAVAPERANRALYTMENAGAMIQKIKNDMFNEVPAKPIAEKAIKQEETESTFDLPKSQRDNMQRMPTDLVPPSRLRPDYERYMAEAPQLLMRRIRSPQDIDAVFERAGRSLVTAEDMEDAVHGVEFDLKQKRAAQALGLPSGSISTYQHHSALRPMISGFAPDDLEEVQALLQRIECELKYIQATKHEEADKKPASTTGSKEKKKKSKPDSFKMIYSDKHESPEEKMAKQSKYAYHFERESPAFVKGEVGSAVTGVKVEEDTA